MEEIDDMETSLIIRFLWRQKKSNTCIHSEMNQVDAMPTISLRTIQKWTSRFNNGELSVMDTPRSGRPKNLELRESIQSYINENPYASAREIAETIECSKTTVSKIRREKLLMTKVNIRLIPKFLNDT